MRLFELRRLLLMYALSKPCKTKYESIHASWRLLYESRITLSNPEILSVILKQPLHWQNLDQITACTTQSCFLLSTSCKILILKQGLHYFWNHYPIHGVIHFSYNGSTKEWGPKLINPSTVCWELQTWHTDLYLPAIKPLYMKIIHPQGLSVSKVIRLLKVETSIISFINLRFFLLVNCFDI